MTDNALRAQGPMTRYGFCLALLTSTPLLLLGGGVSGCLSDVDNPYLSGIFVCSSDAKCADGYVCIRGRCHERNIPVCGDGYVDRELDEQCDDGHANGAYGQCRVDCSGVGAHCGDGVVEEAREVCDGAPYCTPDCRIRTKLTTGAYHGCSLLGDGSVVCWGHGADGQLGNGSLTDAQPSPVHVKALPGPAIDVAAGGQHTCVVLRDGAVACWGADDRGQLGDGDEDRGQLGDGDEDPGQLGDGDEDPGQLGDGDGIAEPGVPVTVKGLRGAARALRAGRSHSCALLDDGGVQCWGSDRRGQLGIGSWHGADHPEPGDVLTLQHGVVSLCAGGHHTCALRADGAVLCWGWDELGQLGDSTSCVDQVEPANEVDLGAAAEAIACGFRHTCALLEGGALACWGSDLEGQLGDDAAVASQPTPVRVEGLPAPVVSVAAGYEHTCAVLRDDDGDGDNMMCWGSNGTGQLGERVVGVRATLPVQVPGLGGAARHVAAGTGHTCALLQDGVTVRCWGAHNFGQLGDGSACTERSGPVTVTVKMTGH